jgi:hypothetical protein
MVALKNIPKISECLRAVEMFDVPDIFLSKGVILIGKFNYPYIFVCCKNINETFYTYWKLTVLFDIPKFWRSLIGIFPRKAFPSSAPYLNSVTRPKSVYSDDLIASPPVKEIFRFKPDLLQERLTPDVSRLKLL